MTIALASAALSAKGSNSNDSKESLTNKALTLTILIALALAVGTGIFLIWKLTSISGSVGSLWSAISIFNPFAAGATWLVTTLFSR